MDLGTDAICRKLGTQKETILRLIGQESNKLGLNAYLVGGAIRDLILGLSCYDLDIVVEGDAYVVVDALCRSWRADGSAKIIVAGKPIKFKKYGTAKLPIKIKELKDISEIDFASARKETYPYSGAQPIVMLGDIAADLARRDFSINALAMVLNDTDFCKIIDNFNGVQHLNQKSLSILHPKSFEDDPARLIRAIRYSVRLGFALEETSATAFNLAVQERYLKRLPRFRLFDEFRKLLSESLWQKMITRMMDYGLLTEVSSCFQDFSASTFENASTIEFDDWSDRLRWLYRNVDYAESFQDLASFGLAPRLILRILKK